MDIKLLVATHKEYRMPEDLMYLPVHVGREEKNYIGFIGDNTGDNISCKNRTFCELTGQYWAWKNLAADYVGLTHYRRHFVTIGLGRNRWKRVLTNEMLKKLLSKTDVILPKPRNYLIETSWNQYAHAHNEIDLVTTRIVISEKYPEYLNAFDEMKRSSKGHRFNMFIMKYSIFDAYSTWLFDILFEVERRLDISHYSDNDARVFGFLGERLLDVWITTNNVQYIDFPVKFMEQQNWIKKGGMFIMRKFGLKELYSLESVSKA